MATPPLLILAFNRPRHTEELIASLRPARPEHIVLAVDGPRAGHPDDGPLVLRTQETVNLIDWDCQVETIFRQENLGLRGAVVDAVTQTVSNHGRAIVVEDDVIVGSNFLPYMSHALSKYARSNDIAHINGYNVVPQEILGHRTGDRLTRYIESFAWATWERSWHQFDPNMEWALNASTAQLRKVTGTLPAAWRWRRTFRDASNELIDTWAYRWLATIWSKGWKVVSPAQNLVRYTGWTDGTHTSRRPKWVEQPVSSLRIDFLDDEWSTEPSHHEEADRWLGSSVFGESFLGVLEGTAVSIALAARKSLIKRRALH